MRHSRGVGLAVIGGMALLMLAACEPGAYQVELFPEQHYQESFKRQQPPRITPPDGAVPITGAEIALSLEQANATKNPCALGCVPETFSKVSPAEAALGMPYSGTLAAAGAYDTPGKPSAFYGLSSGVTLSTTSDVVAHGSEVFRVNCSMCHGLGAKGDGTVGEKLAANGYPHPPNLLQASTQQQSDGRLFYTITNGVAVMPKFGLLLTEQERWSVVVYLRYLAQQASAPAKAS